MILKKENKITEVCLIEKRDGFTVLIQSNENTESFNFYETEKRTNPAASAKKEFDYQVKKLIKDGYKPAD